MTFSRKSAALLSAAVVAAGILAGCSSTPSEPAVETLDPDNPVAITIGTLAAADYAPVYIAEAEGYFAEEGLDVTIEQIAGGAVGVTQLISGELDFTSATWTNALLAVSQGLDVQVVREGTDSTDGTNALLINSASGIDSVEDLRGQTISVNTLGSATELQIRDCLKTEGLEVGDYELVEVPFPEVGAALTQNRIAAGFVPEPFITIGASQGLEPLFSPAACNDRQEGSPIVNWLTSRQYGAENPAVVSAFIRAMDRATQDAIADPQVVIDILPTITTLTPELAAAIQMPNYADPSTPNVEGAEGIMEIMVEYGLLDEPLDDVAQYAWTAP